MMWLFYTLALGLIWKSILVQAGIQLPPEPVDSSTPIHQRVSFQSPSSVSVAWNTYNQSINPCVNYGLNLQALDQQACSNTSITYSTSRTWSNLVHIDGLIPATIYYYQVVSTNSTPAQFMSPRAAGDTTPFSIIALADLGLYGKDGYEGQSRKREEIPNIEVALNHTTIGSLQRTIDDYEFVIHPGDFAYADDWIDDRSNIYHSTQAYTAIIENFYTQLEPITSTKPYMVSPGNHEANCEEVHYTTWLCPYGQNNFSDFQNRFDGMMPTTFASTSTNLTAQSSRSYAATLAKPPFWYSFDYGMVHVVMINTETDFTNAPDEPGGLAGLRGGPFARAGQQIEFLKADLASVDRSITPWVIVAGHRPWYSVGEASQSCAPCQEAFEDLFYEYHVDLGIAGHVHNLQSFRPIYKHKVDRFGYKNPRSTAYIVVGGPGNIEGPSRISPITHGNLFAHNSSYGYGQLTFHNDSYMSIDFIESSTNKNLYSTTLFKDRSVPFLLQNSASSRYR